MQEGRTKCRCVIYQEMTGMLMVCRRGAHAGECGVGAAASRVQWGCCQEAVVVVTAASCCSARRLVWAICRGCSCAQLKGLNRKPLSLRAQDWLKVSLLAHTHARMHIHACMCFNFQLYAHMRAQVAVARASWARLRCLPLAQAPPCVQTAQVSVDLNFCCCLVGAGLLCVGMAQGRLVWGS